MEHKRNNLFISGIILVLIGIGSIMISLALFNLFFLPLWIFLAGVILIWCSYKNILTKILWTISPPIVFIVFQGIVQETRKITPEVYLIPKTLRGKVHIHFNAPCGQAEEFENKKRIYRIPNNGILLTQFKDEYGTINSEYYFVDREGKRTLLPKLDVADYDEEWKKEGNLHEVSRDLLGVFHWGRTGSIQHGNNKQYNFQEFYVWTYQQLMDSCDNKYQRRFDSIEYGILNECEASITIE